MGRTHTITDDDKGLMASLRVETRDGADVVTSLHFDALDGHSITAESLRIAETLGLRLPLPATVDALPDVLPEQPAAIPAQTRGTPKAAPKAAPKPAPKSVKKAATPRGATGKRSRHAGGAPSDAVLASLYHQHGGNQRLIGEALGCHSTTVSNWLRAAKTRDPQPFLDPAAVPAAGDTAAS